MLITKEVEVYLTYNNYKYYQSIGYSVETYTNKQGKLSVKKKKIKVKVEDLPKNARAPVEICCDVCQRHIIVPYSRYCEFNHDGKTFCIHCCARIFPSGDKHVRWDPNKTKEAFQSRFRLWNATIFSIPTFHKKQSSFLRTL